jgi:ATPase subunit of ABC transporter with duplicated ATPase domains
MPNNEITVHDCVSGETVIRPMSADEAAAYEAAMQHADAEEAQNAAQRAAQQAAKESARAKLAALGLTEEEITALVG